MRHWNGEGPDHRTGGVEAQEFEQLGRKLEVPAFAEPGHDPRSSARTRALTDDSRREIPDVVAQEIASVRRLVGNARPEHQVALFKQGATDLWCALKISATVDPESRAATKIAIGDALCDIGSLIGLDDDTVQAITVFAKDMADDQSYPATNDRAVDERRAIVPPLAWIDFSKWDEAPVPERKWAIRDRVPVNQAGLFSGEGGTGKSIIELTKNVAHVVGKDWLGSMPEPGPAFYLGAEDDVDELHIRIAAVAAHYDTTFKRLTEGGLHVLCLLGQDATLCATTRSGKVETTSLFKQIYEAAGDIKPKNISVDTLSRAFAGNEIDRTQVYGFANHMQALAKVAGGSVTVLSHPSLQGVASGSGISGSTAWHGAFRFRQYLKGAKPSDGEQPDGDLRELEFKKNQYGPLGETVVLRYRNGLFLPEVGTSSLDKVMRKAKADEIFLDLLKRLTGEGRNVGDKPNSPSYAPATFVKEAEAKQIQLRKPDFEAAMRRLFASGKIFVESYGRPSRPYSRLALK